MGFFTKLGNYLRGRGFKETEIKIKPTITEVEIDESVGETTPEFTKNEIEQKDIVIRPKKVPKSETLDIIKEQVLTPTRKIKDTERKDYKEALEQIKKSELSPAQRQEQEYTLNTLNYLEEKRKWYTDAYASDALKDKDEIMRRINENFKNSINTLNYDNFGTGMGDDQLHLLQAIRINQNKLDYKTANDIVTNIDDFQERFNTELEIVDESGQILARPVIYGASVDKLRPYIEQLNTDIIGQVMFSQKLTDNLNSLEANFPGRVRYNIMRSQTKSPVSKINVKTQFK